VQGCQDDSKTKYCATSPRKPFRVLKCVESAKSLIDKGQRSSIHCLFPEPKYSGPQRKYQHFCLFRIRFQTLLFPNSCEAHINFSVYNAYCSLWLVSRSPSRVWTCEESVIYSHRKAYKSQTSQTKEGGGIQSAFIDCWYPNATATCQPSTLHNKNRTTSWL
jgi:hypothetical protein